MTEAEFEKKVAGIMERLNVIKPYLGEVTKLEILVDTHFKTDATARAVARDYRAKYGAANTSGGEPEILVPGPEGLQ